MIEAKIVARNSVTLFSAEFINMGALFVLNILIARFLGSAEFGKFAFALAFTEIFFVFSDLGIYRYTIREIARDKTKAGKILGNAIVLKTLLSAATFIAIIFSINLTNSEQITKILVYIIAIYTILTSYIYTFESIFRAFERTEFEAYAKTIERTITISLSIIVLLYTKNLLLLGFVLILSSLASIIYSTKIPLKKLNIGKINLEFDFAFWKQLLKEALPFAMFGIILTILIKIDIVMLELMKNDFVVGWYSAAYKIIVIPCALSSIFLNAIFPGMSRLYLNAKHDLRQVFRRAHRYLSVAGFLFLILLIFYADNIIRLFYGSDFSNSIIALQVLSWLMLAMFMSRIYIYLLNSADMQMISFKLGLVAIAVNVLLNFLLIPQYSFVGAGIATISTELVFFIGGIYYAHKLLGKLNIAKIIIKPAIAAGVAAVVMYLLKDFNIIIAGAAGILVYLSIILLLRSITSRDIQLFKELASGPLSSWRE